MSHGLSRLLIRTTLSCDNCILDNHQSKEVDAVRKAKWPETMNVRLCLCRCSYWVQARPVDHWVNSDPSLMRSSHETDDQTYKRTEVLTQWCEGEVFEIEHAEFVLGMSRIRG